MRVEVRLLGRFEIVIDGQFIDGASLALVRYDERGCGLSDWDVDTDSFTLEAWVRDLETVVDALGLERFPLLGISQGGPIALRTRLAIRSASAT